jgi:hypothetical protein
VIALFALLAGTIGYDAYLQARIDRMERQVEPLAAMEKKLPIDIAVYVSPELGHARMRADLKGLPGWAVPDVQARAGGER